MNKKAPKSQKGKKVPPNTRAGHLFWLVVCYVVFVLGVDALSALQVSWPVDWSMFHWRAHTVFELFSLTPPGWARTPFMQSFDLFKFLFWLVIPFCVCFKRMDWSWFTCNKWKRLDVIFLVLLFLAGTVAVLSIAFVPALQNAYPGLGALPWSRRWIQGAAMLVWVVSWLAGWEFLHRYVLLRAAAGHYPRFGWLVVPLFETAYHLQKPGLEALGMAVFSLLLTWWSLKRKNFLLPFLAHLYIELLLIAALLFLK